MRRVATSLSVAPGALYWHVESKQALVAWMAEAIVAPLLAAPPADPAQLSGRLRECVLAVRDGAEIVVAAISQPHYGVGEGLERAFQSAVAAAAPKGASTSDLRAAARGLLHLTLGGTAVQQSGAQLAAATGEGGPVDADELAADHSRAVTLLLSGLE